MKVPIVLLTLIIGCRLFGAPAPSGVIVAWGDLGRLQAAGTYHYQPTTNVMVLREKALTNVESIAVGKYHFLALRDDSTVFGWGWNAYGQAVGYETPDVDRTNGLVTIEGRILTNVMAIAAGRNFSLALENDGRVVIWGEHHGMKAMLPFPVMDEAEQTNILFQKIVTTSLASGGPGVQTNVATVPRYPGDQEWRGSEMIRTSPVEVTLDGHLEVRLKASKPEMLSRVVAIAARGQYALALTQDGTVIGWSGPLGETAHVPAGLSNIVAVACGGGGSGQYERSMALRKDGQIFVWKAGLPHDESVPLETRNTISITAGGNHSLALQRDGTVFGWGINRDGQATGVPTGQAASDSRISAGLVTVHGQILKNVIAAAAYDDYSLALKVDGTVDEWGNNRFSGSVPKGLTGVIAIAPGDGFCLAITTNNVSRVGSHQPDVGHEKYAVEFRPRHERAAISPSLRFPSFERDGKDRP